MLIVSDAETGDLFAFDLEGTLLDRVETGIDPAGLVVDPSTGGLWMADRKSDAILRLPM